MPNTPWNDRYASGDLPWDTGEPDDNLVRFVRSGGVTPGRALEVGCGTGTNASWLAGQGFDVLGVDLSPLAIEKAQARLGERALPCRFAALDFLTGELPAGEFRFVFDRGCFHVFHEAGQRAVFAERVGKVLGPDGVWLSLIGSTEGPPRDAGPPRRSAREIVEAIEPVLEIVELRAATFQAQGLPRSHSWVCVARRRSVPAQPSTRPA